MSKPENIIPFPSKSELWPGLDANALFFIEKPGRKETSRAYREDWRGWIAWLESRGRAQEQATDEDLANYLAGLARRGLKMATIRRRRAGIEATRLKQYSLPRLSGPVTRMVLDRILEDIRDEQRQAKPLTTDLLRRLIGAIGRRAPVDLRDRALFLVMWQAALRVGEASALDWRDFGESLLPGGTLQLRKTKGARDGRPETAYLVPADDPGLCPLAALAAWRRAQKDPERCLPDAPIFTAAHRSIHGTVRMTGRRLSRRSIGPLLLRRMAAAGLETEGFSSHSLRSGVLTSAADAGVSPWRLKEHARHRQVEMLNIYVRNVTALNDHPAKGLL